MVQTPDGEWRAKGVVPALEDIDIEARRERFFDSLAGASTKRHYAFENLHWGWLVFGFYTLPIIVEVLRRLFR
jgi:hypothetical protein